MKKATNTIKSKIKNFGFCFVVLIFNFLFLIFNSVYAVSLNSPQYRIESASVSNAAGEKSSTNYKLSDTLGQLAAGEFSSQGYVVKAGFQYLRIVPVFKFTLTNSKIDFGQLTPNLPATGTTDLLVSLGGIRHYQVTAEEEGPLKTLSGAAIIADTGCDGGNSSCTDTEAQPWRSSLAFGFGYNITGQDIPFDFKDGSYYRPFPDHAANKPAAVVMSNTNVSKNRQSTMTLKVNISPLQPPGSYQTVINFVATPSY